MVIFIRAVEILQEEYKSHGANDQTITSGLYWSMFEAGIGLIAFCLPSFYMLASNMFQRVFKMGDKSRKSYSRSNLSWNTASMHINDFPKRFERTSTSEDNFIWPRHRAEAGFDAYAMKDIPRDDEAPHEVSTEHIVVTRTVEQAEHMA